MRCSGCGETIRVFGLGRNAIQKPYRCGLCWEKTAPSMFTLITQPTQQLRLGE